MKKIVNHLKLLRAFAALVKDPTRTDRIFEIADLGRERRGPLVEEAVAFVAQVEGVKALHESNYSPQIPSLRELSKYPAGSFGKAFANHMLDNGLQVNFFPVPEGSDLEPYVISRGRKAHDFWHVLTGFDTSVADEIGLQAFTLAQTRTPFSAILISGGLLHAILHAPGIFNEMVDQLFEGYQMGRRARMILGVPIETLLHENLNELRARFQITPISKRSMGMATQEPTAQAHA
jgi:ubiquinone biosynthesis protein COQ4